MPLEVVTVPVSDVDWGEALLSMRAWDGGRTSTSSSATLSGRSSWRRRLSSVRPALSWLVRPNRRVRLPRVEPLDPLSPPGRRLPGIAEVDPLADYLLVAELHDADHHHGVVVVADRVLVNPEVVAAGGAVELELLAGRIGRPEGDDVRLAAQALAALRPLHHSVVGVDLRGACDVVSRGAAGGADVRGVEMRLDHGASRLFVHRNLVSGRG